MSGAVSNHFDNKYNNKGKFKIDGGICECDKVREGMRERRRHTQKDRERIEGQSERKREAERE